MKPRLKLPVEPGTADCYCDCKKDHARGGYSLRMTCRDHWVTIKVGRFQLLMTPFRDSVLSYTLGLRVEHRLTRDVTWRYPVPDQ